MSTPRIPEPTPAAKRYINYMLTFGISVGIGLAPLLGKVDVPGFSSILSLYPTNLAGIVIPFAALLMSVPALAVQYYGFGLSEPNVLDQWFTRALLSMVLLIVTGAAFYLFLVVRVPVDSGKDYATYAVGFTQWPTSPCASESLKTCIGRAISFDPNAVEALFPDWQISLSKLILTLNYFSIMLNLGALVGILILRENLWRSARRAS
jgi:hypothetical protein